MVFLRDGIGPDFTGCCALYALDLKTRNVTKLLDPTSTAIVVSPDGKHVITQRGMGIESFNVHTLNGNPGVGRMRPIELGTRAPPLVGRTPMDIWRLRNWREKAPVHCG